MGCHGEWSELLAGVAPRSRAPLCEPPRSDAGLLWLLHHKQPEPGAGHTPSVPTLLPRVHPADQPFQIMARVSGRISLDLTHLIFTALVHPWSTIHGLSCYLPQF